MRVKHRLAALFAIVLAALALAACSDTQERTAAPSLPANTAAATIKLGQQPEVVQTLDPKVTSPRDSVIEVAAENLSFAPNRLGIAVGESVTIRVTNKDGVKHSLRIAGLDGGYDTDDDAATQDLAGGEVGEVNFAPTVKGNYTFRCDFHPGSMGGRIEVE